MKVRCFLKHGLPVVSVMSLCFQLQAIEGSAGCVALDTKPSAFWRTAVTSTVTIPVDYPQGATVATLAVTGLSHKAVYVVTEGNFSLQLPEPTSPEVEDVYDITLSFDNGVMQKASIACVAGASHGGTASGVRVLFAKDSRKWQRVRGWRAVLPLPYGMRSFIIDGNSIDAGLDGAAGWYAFGPLETPRSYALSMTDSDFNVFETTLFGAGLGLAIILR